MTGVKISELPDALALNGSETVPAVQTGVTSKTTMADILAYVQANLVESVQQSVETFTLSPTDITNKYVELAQTPAVAANVAAFVGGNTPGVYGDEFEVVSGNRLSWSGKNWEGLLVSGDKIVANYFY